MSDLTAPPTALDVDTFSYIVAHDLRPPLRRLADQAAALDAALSAGDLKEGKLQSSAIQSELGRMSAFIEGVRQFALASGTTGSTPDTKKAVLEAWSAWEAPQGFELKVDGELPPLPVPPLHAAVVLRALLNNAVIHHHLNEGTVTVTGGADSGGWLRISDDGPGLPSPLNQLCEPFWPRPQRPPEAGVGIGLALSQHVLLHHGGQLLHKQSSEGTVLHLQFKTH